MSAHPMADPKLLNSKFVVKGKSLHQLIVESSLLGAFCVDTEELDYLALSLKSALKGIAISSPHNLSVTGAYPAFLVGEVDSYDFIDVYVNCCFLVEQITWHRNKKSADDSPWGFNHSGWQDSRANLVSCRISYESGNCVPELILFQLLTRYATVTDLIYEEHISNDVFQIDIGRVRYYFCLIISVPSQEKLVTRITKQIMKRFFQKKPSFLFFQPRCVHQSFSLQTTIRSRGLLPS